MTRRADQTANADRTRTRCAIYTRKSSEEGLEQAFNSLDAQRETCEAYVHSQKHEGWIVLPQMYDDGGISGGTMERLALGRLLDDIAADQVDTVVVYKVDRLTRSLSDFAKIVDIFERHNVTFVSVTQSFNTTTSMGRLTLNMLLSFAQFEREVAGERIRDKIAASKKKGMWMGGLPPLGYDVNERKLVVRESEAETVRHIFHRYSALGSVRTLKQELDVAGINSKRRTDRFGRETGGKLLSRGALYLMLQNRIYRGEVVHRGASYPGEHDAIVAEALWNDVQSRLASNRVERRNGKNAIEPSLLVGLVHDEHGERMTPTHANKNGTRYRYYVSKSLIQGRRGDVGQAGMRLPAGELERLVETRILAFLAAEAPLYELLQPVARDAARRRSMVGAASGLAASWSGLAPSVKCDRLQQLIERIDVRTDGIEIAIHHYALFGMLAGGRGVAAQSGHVSPISLNVTARLRRAGKGMRLLIDGPSATPRSAPDRSLLRLLGQAHRFQTIVLRGNGAAIANLARDAGVDPSYFTRVLKLGFLAPQITAAILDGHQPAALNAHQLTRRAGQLALDWSAQAEQLGLG